MTPPQPSNDWPILHATWRAIKWVAAALMLGWVGGVTGGVSLGLATICAYGIGAWIGLPLGFVFGFVMSTKRPKSDSGFIFGIGSLIWVITYIVVGPVPATGPGALNDFIPPIVGAAGYALAFAIANFVPRTIRQGIAATVCPGLVVYGTVLFLQRIYSQ